MNLEDLKKSTEEIKSQRQKRHRAAMSSIKAKALATIEGILLTTDSEGEMLGTCYKFAHVALGHCRNPHNDWLEELDSTYKALRKGNII